MGSEPVTTAIMVAVAVVLAVAFASYVMTLLAHLDLTAKNGLTSRLIYTYNPNLPGIPVRLVFDPSSCTLKLYYDQGSSSVTAPNGHTIHPWEFPVYANYIEIRNPQGGLLFRGSPTWSYDPGSRVITYKLGEPGSCPVSFPNLSCLNIKIFYNDGSDFTLISEGYCVPFEIASG